MLQAVFYAQMASEAEAVPHRGRARRHQPEAGAPPSARLRRGIGGIGRRGAVASGAESRTPSKGGAQEGRRTARRRAARAARAGGSAADRLQGRGRRVRLGECRAGARQAPRRTGRVRRRRAATPRRTNWKTNSATCCSCWSTWRASSKWIPSRRCAAPTPSSARRWSHIEARLARAGPQAGRRNHRRNGGPVAGSEAQVAPIEIRQLFHLEEFDDVVELQKTIWSFADIELLPLRFLVVVTKVGGHVFGAFDGARMIGFCFAIPGIKPDGRPYLHSHMLGVLPEYRNAQIGPPPQAPPARGCPGARHRADRVDLRSAGAQERLFQYREAGRHRAALRGKSVRHHHAARCTAVCRPTAASPNGGSIRRACTPILDGPRDQTGRHCGAHRVSRRYRRHPRAGQRPRARNPADQRASFSWTPSRAAWPSPASSAPRREGVYLLEPWQ